MASHDGGPGFFLPFSRRDDPRFNFDAISIDPMKAIQRTVLVTLALAVCIGLVFIPFLLDMIRFTRQPLNPSAPQQVVRIAAGDPMAAVAGQLEAAGIVANARKFRLLAYYRGDDRRIQAGEYRLSGAMSPRVLLRRLVDGKVSLSPVTIPEGYHLRQIATTLAAAEVTDPEDFMQYVTDRANVEAFGLNAETMEGYLFPDTYAFSKSMPPAKIVAVMFTRFEQVFTDVWRQRAADIGLTVHEVVTLASIIEKETGQADERPLISSVFHNRLRRGMRLETDPTVIYGIADFDGNLSRKHLTTPGPYNTYLNKGLPPGPIASPGALALKAALYPVDSKFLYFVSRKDRTHQFSATLRQHNRAVRKYQLGHRRK